MRLRDFKKAVKEGKSFEPMPFNKARGKEKEMCSKYPTKHYPSFNDKAVFGISVSVYPNVGRTESTDDRGVWFTKGYYLPYYLVRLANDKEPKDA